MKAIYNDYAEDYARRNLIPNDKLVPLQTLLHYTDPTARQERTVFGSQKPHLFYNYSDRLDGDLWRKGEKAACEARVPAKSARYFEIILNTFHGVEDVDLQHVILGCNMSTGYDYLVFGYTYGKNK